VLSWLFLTAAILFLAVANGRWILPFAGWLAPTFLLLFVQSRPPRVGLGLGFLAQLAAFSWNWQGMIPAPGVWYFLVTAVYAVVYFVPFAIHRGAAHRLPGVRSTLVLPTAWVAIEFLFQRFASPYGSWASLAYTQVDRLPLLQLTSWTGVAGVHFLMLWFAAVCSRAWHSRKRSASLLRVASVYLGVFLIVWFAGAMRIRTVPRDVPTFRVAGITPSARLTSDLRNSMSKTPVSSPGNGVVGTNRDDIANRINADLLEKTRGEARAGSDLIVWSEHAGAVTRETEALLVRQVQGIAREFDATIVMGLGVWRPHGQPSFENKAVVVSAEGDRPEHYFKAKPIVGRETSLVETGDSRPRIIGSPDARFAVVICHDLDFPDFIRPVGQENVLALLAPSADWPDITPLHARMAIARAVENGCSLVRPCENGLSLAVDPLGRIFASQRDHGPDGNVMVCHVPRFRMFPPYSHLGNLFAWLCTLGLLVLVVSGRTAPGRSAR
jgi:apolipoprotein N-acyltransferase